MKKLRKRHKTTYAPPKHSELKLIVKKTYFYKSCSSWRNFVFFNHTIGKQWQDKIRKLSPVIFPWDCYHNMLAFSKIMFLCCRSSIFHWNYSGFLNRNCTLQNWKNCKCNYTLRRCMHQHILSDSQKKKCELIPDNLWSLVSN